MELLEVLSPVLGARCTLIGGASGALVVDPGVGVAPRVRELAAARGWAVRAVLLTHGHLDHTWDAGALSDELDVPVLVHPGDRYRLADPFGTLGIDPALLGLDPSTYRAPGRVLGLDDEAVPGLLALGSGWVEPWHAPGHTEGSTVYLVHGDDRPPVVLSGDVLFAGTVGRTDLPGGDEVAMARTLTQLARRLDPGSPVHPGHGPRTLAARELATNGYLRRS